MKRRSTGNAFDDISIHGDELENHRIQLEKNLQNTDLSFRLSSTSDDDDGFTHRRPNHRESSVEYPRHLSEPSGPEFPSFMHRSSEHFGDEDQSRLHAWSYRSGDDEEGISPYGGETVSTAAHHASALTLSAGLGGGRAARQRDPSMSGAEYDPDRPLHAMIAGVNSKHSMFAPDHQTTGMTYDPLVVDSTAELDRILESGHAPPPSMGRPPSPTSSVTSSGSDSSARRRPKLTDHLRHVSFSPKRPRSAQLNPVSPLSRSTRQMDPELSMNAPTPRPARRSNIFPSYASSPATVQPEVRLHPATPSSTGSKFTRMARGINKELEATQQELNAAASRQNIITRPASAPAERNPFHDAPNQTARSITSARNPTPRRSAMRDTTRSRIHLPDVTGLTNAVESPMKHGAQYYPYKSNERPRESEARLLSTLSAVQGQLLDLEEENGISRRRVHELEMELEECKRQVARERTRLFEREEISIRGHANTSYRTGGSKGRGKAKARDTTGVREGLDDVRLHERYKEVVEEKKDLFPLSRIGLLTHVSTLALEALISSLRSHLTRLTSELASHQALLSKLRRLRDSDAQALREKGAEILQLKEEVQRLAGEVEVLRGVVEEGLKERRSAREIHIESSAADLAMSQDLEEEENDDELEEEEEEQDNNEQDRNQGVDEQEFEDDEDEDDEPAPFDPNPAPLRTADRTMRTDFATLGSSTNSAPPRFVNDDELDLIAAEVEERRSNLSNASSVGSGSGTQRARSRSGSPARNKRATVEDAHEEAEPEKSRRHHWPSALPTSSQQPTHYAPQPQLHTQPAPRFAPSNPEPSSSRPTAPTPGRASRVHDRRRTPEPAEPEPETETPFPQIRGEHLERLFFSAPEHNAKTCTVCFRRRNRPNGGASSPSWSHPHGKGPRDGTKNNAVANDDGPEEDEGYEGSDDADVDHGVRGTTNGKGKERERERESERELERQFVVSFSQDPSHWRQAGRKHGLPPQTVVARVIRELEDDFTHYKSIYVELADQYKVMDAVSDVPRRNLLARHLREVVDILELKGDQIASLYDLLQFKDRPNSESIIPNKSHHPPAAAAGPTSTSNFTGGHAPPRRRRYS
ncbi:hypothetical protein M413DRAFT_32104 [Hebeloma cylindrosporum]|uniref:Cep57 centrosome microtubule-binding domain-containing protein n=1 Tax=Hebeloma cylindrosporum TaxID=76867 RepID=A0A0C3BGK5_HEBCY|nr:hypothetical protein M413DRAFT_32104 [Hebeloma cylindrosporum h7]